jgi:hypothetical protein
VAANKPNGQPWDTGFGSGLPDPFCQVTLDGMIQQQTSVLTDTLMPMWSRPTMPNGPGNPGGPGGPGNPGGPGGPGGPGNPGGPGGPNGPGNPGGPNGSGGPGASNGNAGASFTANALISDNHRWQISVIDDDGFSPVSDSICAVTPQLTASDFTAGMVVFPSTQSCLSLTIQLVCAD